MQQEMIDQFPATWKIVPYFENHYKVSRDGKISSINRVVIRTDGRLCTYPEKQIDTRINNRGYESVRLSKGGKTVTRFVHRIVAQAFVPNPENKPCVNHINGLKIDNRCENLEWVTHQENIRHAYDTGLVESNKGGLHHMATMILNESTGETWSTIQDAAKALGINYNTLRHQLQTQGVSSLRKIKVADLETTYPVSSN